MKASDLTWNQVKEIADDASKKRKRNNEGTWFSTKPIPPAMVYEILEAAKRIYPDLEL